MSKSILRMRENFFDSAKIKREMDSATRRGLSQIGAYTRAVARRSLRARPRPSSPGRPPHVVKGSPLKSLLLFSYDRTAKSVVIGPEAIGQSRVPAVLEFGGTAKPSKGDRDQSPRVIKARPFMGPAFEVTQTKIPDVFDGILEKRR